MYCDQYLCRYCFTSCAIRRKRTTFKPDELATTFVSLQREKRVDGLFLSSGIVPTNPRAWLVSAGRFKDIDALRRRARFDASLAALAEQLDRDVNDATGSDDEGVADDRLRLIFICCHPALAPEAQVALTLREVCGLTTEAIARAFLGPAAGLALIDAILASGDLSDYYLAHSARAELCRRLGRTAEARVSYERALGLTQPEPERRFLERRLGDLLD